LFQCYHTHTAVDVDTFRNYSAYTSNSVVWLQKDLMYCMPSHSQWVTNGLVTLLTISPDKHVACEKHYFPLLVTQSVVRNAPDVIVESADFCISDRAEHMHYNRWEWDYPEQETTTWKTTKNAGELSFVQTDGWSNCLSSAVGLQLVDIIENQFLV
jgi:hypothetical protein